MTSSVKKVKLRTVSDIVSRLRWEQQYESCTCIIGYDDRLHGPLEKLLEDYISIANGGDLPEHRIWYIRSGRTVLWDKLGRIDRLFGSGNGADGPASPECQIHIQEASVNMDQLAQEKEQRRKQKEKERARKARRRNLQAKSTTSLLVQSAITRTKATKRFQWKESPTFSWSGKKWSSCEDKCMKTKKDRLVFLTWNVLFDLYDGEQEASRNRWIQLVAYLATCDADVMALQEVTPAFIDILFSSSWVQNYVVTSTVDDSTSVSPSGNLLLWRRSVFSAKQVELCIDGDRRRVVLAILEHDLTLYTVANVHLPADHGMQLRDIARQRELSAVLARMQRIEGRLIIKPVPVILGDFNSGDEHLLQGGSFVDSWQALHPNVPGLTFDPERNVRAARTLVLTNSDSLDRKRLDRIFLGKNSRMKWDKAEAYLVGSDCPPLSDHYGVQLVIPKISAPTVPCLHPMKSIQCNSWASNAPTTKDALLGLLLSTSKLGGHFFFNSQSSLPLPHITLLHGFIEFDGCNELLTQALGEVIAATVQSSSPLFLKFTAESMDIFEHRSSATLVCSPNLDLEENKWLLRLYRGLRLVFKQCHEQESRFVTGWSPHISLGSFASGSQAREAASKYTKALRESISLDVHGLTAFERSSDGKFHANHVVPLVKPQPNLGSCDVKKFLSLMGRPWVDFFEDTSGPVICEIDRSIRDVVGPSIESKVVIYGSHALGASMPGISDVDAMVDLSSSDLQVLRSLEMTFFQQLTQYLELHFRNCKIRLRDARAGAIGVLTVKLWPSAPDIDLTLCCSSSSINTSPIGQSSSVAYDAILETNALLQYVGTSNRALFEATLRIIKLWAHRRQVYGLGFLGGGGYAVWLAKLIAEHSAQLPSLPQEVAALFFNGAAQKAEKLPIRISCWDNIDVMEARREDPLLLVQAPRSLSNHGRNATRSTIHAMQQELQRAVKLVKCLIVNKDYRRRLASSMELVLSPLTPESFSVYTSILIVKVTIAGRDNMSQQQRTVSSGVKAKGCDQMLSLMVALEYKVGNPSLIRPFLRPICSRLNGNTVFTWLVGIYCKSQFEMQHFVQREEAAFRLALTGTTVHINCMASHAAMERLK